MKFLLPFPISCIPKAHNRRTARPNPLVSYSSSRNPNSPYQIPPFPFIIEGLERRLPPLASSPPRTTRQPAGWRHPGSPWPSSRASQRETPVPAVGPGSRGYWAQPGWSSGTSRGSGTEGARSKPWLLPPLLPGVRWLDDSAPTLEPDRFCSGIWRRLRASAPVKGRVPRHRHVFGNLEILLRV